jgi:hypothetical protein
MKNILSIALTLFFISLIVTPSNAQKRKIAGKVQDAVITYDMKLDGDNPMASMMGDITMKIGFNGTSSNANVNMMNGMVITDICFDNEKKEGILLMNMMSKKIAVKMNEEEMKAYQQKQSQNTAPPKIEYFKKETKKIAGYKCYKVVATTGKDTEPVIMYVTEGIQPTATSQWEMQYPGMTGYPLSIEITQQGMKVNILANNVDAEAAKDIKYSSEIPSGYEEMTVKELQELSKGGGGLGM